MGAPQSKPLADSIVEEKLAERLRAMRIKNNRELVEGDYVYVDDAPPEYTSHTKHLSIAAAAQWEKELLEDPKNRLALTALTSNPANSILSSRAAVIADTQIFNIKIPHEGSPITNQRSSGRCWLFAALNVFRIAIMKRYKLAEFELSQSYLFYWDKLEKANYFLENILETAEEGEPLDGRLVQELLASPVGDGGQFTMVKNLVEKYGLVPRSLYPDSYNAMNSRSMDRIITTKLREDALRLRSMVTSKDPSMKMSVAAAKAKMLKEIHLILTIMLGPPPSAHSSFDWEFYDRDGTYQHIRTTPLDFAAQLSDKRTVQTCGGTDVNRLFSLVNDPRNDYNTLLTVNRLNNVHEGSPIAYANVDMSTMKQACVAMLRRGLPIFFGCDVGKYSDSARGIMDTDLYEYELGFNVRLGLTKAERLRTKESAMTHAMVLTAVHVDPESGKTVRWRVENSWSKTAGEEGYFVMSDAWMDDFVYMAVVDPAVVDGKVREVLGMEPKVLELWDPMGVLARG